jgi:predicted TIM-barrel fold metal-dependent hydrolase
MTRREFNRGSLAALAALLLPRMARASAVPFPMNSVDSHAHVFLHDLPMIAGRRYTPQYDAPSSEYLRMLDQHGVARGVLIQPSFLGTDNRYMIAALRKEPRRLRGVAVVEPTATEAELAELAAVGVVGLRLNLFGLEMPSFAAAPWPGLLRQVVKLDWQIEVHREARDMPAIVAPLLDAGVKVVIDHFGRPDPALGVDDPGFRYLLSVAGSRRVWVKLSGAYRLGANGRGDEIARVAVPLLRSAFGPERLLWGSDWPHTQMETVTNYSIVRAQFDTWVTDLPGRQAILEATPAQLFKFA